MTTPAPTAARDNRDLLVLLVSGVCGFVIGILYSSWQDPSRWRRSPQELSNTQSRLLRQTKNRPSYIVESTFGLEDGGDRAQEQC
jgi:hypothetical protein